jgi:hypothetical protein
MTILNVLVYLALIGYVMVRRVQGQPVKASRKLFILPVLLVVLGYGDATQGGTMKPLAITLIVIGGTISLGLGLLRGRTDNLSVRDGSPFVRWGVASLVLFVGNIAAKVILDLVGIAAGGTSSAVGKSLLLTFGLTLLGEAVVIWMRTGGATALLNPSRAAAAPPRRPTASRVGDVVPPAQPSIRYQSDDQPHAPASSRGTGGPEAEPVGRAPSLRDGVDWLRRQIIQPGENAASSTTRPRSLADAVQQHHKHHHDHKHDRGHRHEHDRR